MSEQPDLRKTQSLYWQVMALSVVMVALGINFLAFTPTFLVYRLPNELWGSIFLALALARLASLVRRNVRLLRATMWLSVVAFLGFAPGTMQPVLEGKGSLQLSILYIGLGVMELVRLIMDSFFALGARTKAGSATAANQRTVWAFVAFALVASLVVGSFGWQFNVTRKAAEESREVAAESRRVAAVSRQFASENRRLLKRAERTIRHLCEQGYILERLVQGAIVLVRQPPNGPDEREFLEAYRSDRVQILDGLTSEDSPCNVG